MYMYVMIKQKKICTKEYQIKIWTAGLCIDNAKEFLRCLPEIYLSIIRK